MKGEVHQGFKSKAFRQKVYDVVSDLCRNKSLWFSCLKNILLTLDL